MLSGNDVQNAALQAAELDISTTAGSTLGIHKPFEPEDHDLDPAFRLTRFSEIKTRGNKVQQDVLNSLLKGLKMGNQSVIQATSNSLVTNESNHQNNHQNVLISKTASGQIAIGYSGHNQTKDPPTHKRIEIGTDCCVLPIKNTNLSLVETTNSTYMLVDDPYVMGKIACSNVLSNLYALGITRCDNMLMQLNVSYKMTDKERNTVIPILIRGFRDCALEAGTTITGGHTSFNPWLSIGGTATSVLNRNEYLLPDSAVPGDVLVLTKPLGTQIALLAYQWLDNPERWNRIKLVVGEEDVHKAYLRTMDSMSRLNVVAAGLMHKFKVHAATDVGGFGLLGHADFLAKNQKNNVSFVLHNLPVINKLSSIAKTCGKIFTLTQGTSPETSGGLLIAFPREQATAFCKEIEKQEGYPAWIVGIVEKGDKSARIIDKPRIIEIPSSEKEGELW